ncbi:MAG: SMP-30/gluconolactonase/LRE family protein [Pirellulales bacterium]|nr:SMP-30/gluconolactonase/LRE family protein [Pirellulales bacterium]
MISMRTRQVISALWAVALVSVGISARAEDGFGLIERVDPRVDQLIPADTKLEKLAEGFEWTEGPVWVPQQQMLLFSDIPNNVINRWKEGAGVTAFFKPAGYTGTAARGGEPGSNGLQLDPQGRLTMCEHGDRRVTRLEPLASNGKKVVLADRFEGKRFNSPNDLVFDRAGNLYFTDPPYGLPQGKDDPARELDFCGVYRLSKDGKLTLLTKQMTFPNGIGLSPDEKTLYVAQSDPDAAIWMAFELRADGTLGAGRKLHDTTQWVGKRKGLPDGLSVDTHGNLFATGPGGVLILSPKGEYLGRIETGEATANCCFGGDGTTLYITADMYLCRIKTATKGLGF